MKDYITYTVTGIGEHGKFFDNNAYRDSINYIFSPEKAAYIGGCNVSCAERAAQEMEQTAEIFHKNKGKRVRHSIISFDAKSGMDAENAKICADKIIQYYAPEYQIVYAVHDNTDNVHIHLVMNQIAYTDGHRYQGKKKDFYDFQKYIGDITKRPVIYAK